MELLIKSYYSNDSFLLNNSIKYFKLIVLNGLKI